MKKEGEITINFSKTFSHPSLLLNYQTFVPLTKKSDIYSLCLSLLTINSYKMFERGTFYYSDILKQMLESVDPDKLYKELAEKIYIESFNDMFEKLKTFNFYFFDDSNIRGCITFVCVLL